MLKLLKYFLWVVVILSLVIGFDQLMVKLPLHTPGVKQTQQFYVDFRSRLIKLFPGQHESDPPVDAIEAVIEKKTAPAVRSTKKTGRYLYVDSSGILQFADSFQQVPTQYRQDAQPLAE
ncbi:MAG: hypothetical protein U9Q61_06550 [Thermodesulfobacteriota bacterium]|nr:hypothetical protein [Thermodesulfobacteriota bacterium]